MHYPDWLWQRIERDELTPDQADELLRERADLLHDMEREDAVIEAAERAKQNTCIDTLKEKESNL
jgi:hypothetical protein